MIILKFVTFVVLYTPVIICSENVESVEKATETGKVNSAGESDIVSPVPVAMLINEDKSGDKLINVNKNSPKIVDNLTPGALKSTVVSNISIIEKDVSKAAHNDEDKEKQTSSAKLIPEQISKSNIEINIPVAVIYDPVPEYTQNRVKVATDNKDKTNTSTEKVVDTSIKNKVSNETKAEEQLIKEVSLQSKPARTRTVRRQQRKQNSNAKNNDLNEKVNIKNTGNTENITKSNMKLRKRTRERDPIIPIVQSESYVFSHKGDFHYSYESGDGTKASERGHLRNRDENAGEAVVGSFSYIGKDGNDYSLTYTADENGYRPVGAHLPTPPPIPPAIARALAYLATKTTPESITEPTK